MEYLSEKVKNLPAKPGCYIFKNRSGAVIYVGKSKVLRSRVSQYFHNITAKEGKYRRLAQEITDLEYLLTETERDALLLEFKLIRQYLPKYNVLMKRDRSYVYLCIAMNEKYPFISIENEVKPGADRYFGFFYNADQAAETVRLINSIWNTPVCGKKRFPLNHRPCLNYQLGICCAPCVGKPDQQEYHQKISEICACLSGNHHNISSRLKQNMNAAVASMEYEKAAYFRDLMAALEQLGKRSRRLNTVFEERRVFLFFRAFREQEFALFYILDGMVRKRADYKCNDLHDAGDFLEFGKAVVALGRTLPAAAEQTSAGYLGEIFADKYYVTVPSGAKAPGIAKLLWKGYLEYTGEAEQRL